MNSTSKAALEKFVKALGKEIALHSCHRGAGFAGCFIEQFGAESIEAAVESSGLAAVWLKEDLAPIPGLELSIAPELIPSAEELASEPSTKAPRSPATPRKKSRTHKEASATPKT